MYMRWVAAALGAFVILALPLASTADDSSGLDTCERGAVSKFRQKALIGKWKATGYYENGKIQPLGTNDVQIHEFRDDCTVFSVTDGETSTFQYSIEDARLVLVTPLLGRSIYSIERLTKETFIYGGNVMTRVK